MQLRKETSGLGWTRLNQQEELKGTARSLTVPVWTV